MIDPRDEEPEAAAIAGPIEPTPRNSDLARRLRRMQRHLGRWARRQGCDCWRVYSRDLPDQPLEIDVLAGWAVVWAYERTRDETPEQDEVWLGKALAAVAAGLDLPPERIVCKRRLRQRRRREGAGQYQASPEHSIPHEVCEDGLHFELDLGSHLDTGLFLDQRLTRRRLRQMAAGKRVLNCFAYSGAFTVHAAAGGAAASLSLDLSRPYCAWIQRNLLRNALSGPQHRVHPCDCLAWLGAAPAERWDLIVCDPPTFSNSKRMDGTWQVGRDHPWLLWRLWDHLLPGGTCLFSCNERGFELAASGLPPFACREITAEDSSEDFRGRRQRRVWELQRPQ